MSTEDPRDQQIREKDQQICDLIEKLAQAFRRIEELERRLGLNSDNSSKPPSSDGLRRTQSLREKSGKPCGGQPNHKGGTLRMVSNPNKVEQHFAKSCEHCQAHLCHEDAYVVDKRQVFDIPPIVLEVTEHQLLETPCKCGHKSRGRFPESVRAAVQYGPRVRATVAYYRDLQLLPEERTAEVLYDLYGCSISAGTIGAIQGEIAQKAEPDARVIYERLLLADVKHADESGVRIAGKTQWVHVLSNDTDTSYRMEEKRGAIPDIRVGTAVHDCFAPYDKLTDVKHALCNAHLLRELKAVAELDKESWATDVGALLKSFNKLKDDYRLVVPLEEVSKCRMLLHTALNKAIEFYDLLPPYDNKKQRRGREKKRPGHNLALRMLDRIDSVLLFLSDPAVPFTNNQAERDLRMIKTQQKISGCFRTSEGANNFAILRSVISTVRKRGENIFKYLYNKFSSEPAPNTS